MKTDFKNLKKQQGKKSWQQGKWAERIACLYLILKGYRFLKRRYKNAFGEIDLILRKGNQVIFVEIKFRPSFDTAVFSIRPLQQKRIERAALYFLSKYYPTFGGRFDAVFINRSWHIRHIKNAWGIKI